MLEGAVSLQHVSAVKCNVSLVCWSVSPQEHMFGITEMITILKIDCKIKYTGLKEPKLFRFI